MNDMKIYLSEPGFICAAGNSSDAASFVNNLSSGIRNVSKVDCGIEGEGGKKSFYVGKIEDSILKPVDDRFDMRLLRILDFALNCLSETVEKAAAKYGRERIGVCIGSCDNGSELSFKAHKAFFEAGNFPCDYDLKAQGADYPAVFTLHKFNLSGISLAFSTACSSSASAIIKASQLIRAGVCDAVIAGGVDVASDTVLLGFDSLEAVDHDLTNPFSKNRKGINLGEGAAVFLLSKDDLDNTGLILAGCGESCDASHMTAPLEDGSGAFGAMKAALEDAELAPEDIDYINLHGTGTRLNDSMEARGISLLFDRVPVKLPLCSSTKPLTGHTLGAAGSLEAAVCFYALKTQRLPLHVWDGVYDEEFPELNFVKSSVQDRCINVCMSNSFAFGGCNASLILKRESR